MNHEIARVSPIEQKKRCTNTEHGVEVVGSCKYGIHDPLSKGFSNARPDGSDLAITNIEKVDQDSMGTAASNNMMTTKDATRQIDKVSDFLQNPPEDREQGDFVDYGWANIGSFDDLDRIFRCTFGATSCLTLRAEHSPSMEAVCGAIFYALWNVG